MKRETLMQLQHERANKNTVALVTRLGDGLQALTYPDGKTLGELSLTKPALEKILESLALGQNRNFKEPDTQNELFVRSYIPPYRLIIVGAVHISQALAPMARDAGYEVVVIDPRSAFATEARFGGVEMVSEWPKEALQDRAPDAQTAFVTLTHDPKIDDPALEIALRSDAFYIGALGSKRTHASRLKRLAEAGLADASERICAPVGLDLGGRAPAEIAVAILAQIIQHRYQVTAL